MKAVHPVWRVNDLPADLRSTLENPSCCWGPLSNALHTSMASSSSASPLKPRLENCCSQSTASMKCNCKGIGLSLDILRPRRGKLGGHAHTKILSLERVGAASGGLNQLERDGDKPRAREIRTGQGWGKSRKSSKHPPRDLRTPR